MHRVDRDPDAPLERRRRGARKALQRALAASEDPAARLAAVEGYLAALSKEEHAAWVGRDPRRWWRERGGDPQTAPAVIEHWVGLLSRLERAVYGGAQESPAQSELLSAADELWKALAQGSAA